MSILTSGWGSDSWCVMGGRKEHLIWPATLILNPNETSEDPLWKALTHFTHKCLLSKHMIWNVCLPHHIFSTPCQMYCAVYRKLKLRTKHNLVLILSNWNCYTSRPCDILDLLALIINWINFWLLVYLGAACRHGEFGTGSFHGGQLFISLSSNKQ